MYKVVQKILSILFCLPCLLTNAQGFILETGEINKYNIPHAFTKINNFYFFNHTEMDTSIDFAHSYLSKINSNGNIINAIKLDSVRLISVFSKDNFLFAMGGKLLKNTPLPKEFSTVFYKIDSDLQIIATFELYTPTQVHIPYDFMSYNTDTLIYAGWKFDSVNMSTDYDLCLLLDNSLQPLFIDSFPHVSFDKDISLPKLLHIPSSKYLYITGLNNIDYNPPFFDTLIYYSFAVPIKKDDFTIQSTDTILFQENLSGFQTEWFASLPRHALIYDDSTSLLSVHTNGTYPNNQDYSNMGIIMLNGNLKANKMLQYPFYHASISKMPAYYNSLDISNDGKILYAGTYNCDNMYGICINNNRNIKICVVKTDTNGTIIWQKIIGGDSVDYYVTCMKTTLDGGVLIGVMTKDTSLFNYNQKDITKALIIKLDGNGNMVFTNTLPYKNEKPMCYPNPTNTNLLLKNITDITPYSIVNINGQIVCTGIYTGEPISVQALPSGLYVLHLQKKNNAHVLRFVKE